MPQLLRLKRQLLRLTQYIYFSIKLTLISFRKIPTLTKKIKPSLNRTQTQMMRNSPAYSVKISLSNGPNRMLPQENPLNMFQKQECSFFLNSTMPDYPEV